MPQILNAPILIHTQYLLKGSECCFTEVLQFLFISTIDFMLQALGSFVSCRLPINLLNEVNLTKFLFQFHNV